MVVQWVLGKEKMESLVLLHWMEDIKRLMENFSFLSIQHISRVYNGVADALLKQKLGPLDGIICYNILHNGKLDTTGSINYFEN